MCYVIKCWMHVNTLEMEHFYHHRDVRTTVIVSMVRGQILRVNLSATVRRGILDNTANKVWLDLSIYSSFCYTQ